MQHEMYLFTLRLIWQQQIHVNVLLPFSLNVNRVYTYDQQLYLSFDVRWFKPFHYRLVNANKDFQSKSKGEEMKMNTIKYTNTLAWTNPLCDNIVLKSRPVFTQYSHKVALSMESALALSPPAWSPLRYFPPGARMAILLRSQNSKRNWTGVGLLLLTALSSPTLQYFPWESGQTAPVNEAFRP